MPFFPLLNAVLNGTSAVLILMGRRRIRQGRVVAHRRFMISAVVTSSLFLASYVYYHAHVGSVRFQGQGLARPIYFSVLISHTSLALAVMPMVLITLSRALRGRFERHKASARWTFPVWLYVSITGVMGLRNAVSSVRRIKSIPLVRADAVGTNDLRAHSVQFCGKGCMAASFFDVDHDGSQRRIVLVGAHTNTHHGRICHQSACMELLDGGSAVNLALAPNEGNRKELPLGAARQNNNRTGITEA